MKQLMTVVALLSAAVAATAKPKKTAAAKDFDPHFKCRIIEISQTSGVPGGAIQETELGQIDILVKDASHPDHKLPRATIVKNREFTALWAINIPEAPKDQQQLAIFVNNKPMLEANFRRAKNTDTYEAYVEPSLSVRCGPKN